MNQPLASDEEYVTQPDGHEPVLLTETLRFLEAGPGRRFVDATLGLGGHAEALLDCVGPSGCVVGIDRDPAALELARRRLDRFGDAFVALHGDHREIARLLAVAGFEAVDGILFDLGVSSLQLDDPARGFSFRSAGPLDMRMDPSTTATAAELVATLSEEDLRGILWRYGEERRARAIARAIVEQRSRKPLRTTLQLAELVTKVAGPAAARYRIHPATRTFQALRIAVNDELDELERTVEAAVDLLRPGGRIVLISFHSLEDRKVKRTLKRLASACVCPRDLPVCGCGRRDRVRILTTKPVRPTAGEVDRNPRARSSKLRAAERV